MTKTLNLHMISDSTGETVTAVTKAALAQFQSAMRQEYLYPLIRTPDQLDTVITSITASPGPVIYTLVDEGLIAKLKEACRLRNIPCLGVLDPVLGTLSDYLGEAKHQPGRQHVLDDDYFARIAAMEFAIAHDDGQRSDDLAAADIILLGVSRCSKTPTCLYLANRGYKAANIPLVPGVELPPKILALNQPLIVGLTNSPERLSSLRRVRLREMGADPESHYAEPDSIEEELRAARRLFTRHNFPVIDVSNRAIEETAAQIITLYSNRRREG